MKIQIELLIAGIIFLIFLVWFVWHNLSRWIARKKYKPEKNKSRPGGVKQLKKLQNDVKENKRAELGRGVGETESREPDVDEPSQPAEQVLRDPASPAPTGKNRHSVRGIFKKLRR